MGKYVYIKSWAVFSISVCLDLAEVEEEYVILNKASNEIRVSTHFFYTNDFSATKIPHSGSVGTTPSFYKQPVSEMSNNCRNSWIYLTYYLTIQTLKKKFSEAITEVIGLGNYCISCKFIKGHKRKCHPGDLWGCISQHVFYMRTNDETWLFLPSEW